MHQQSTSEIAEALEAFLRRERVQSVHFAGGSSPPPQLAYLVSFPRLSIVLSGQDRMEIEEDGQTRQITMKRGEAVFVPANCWNKPAWASRVKVLTFLFGKRQTGVSLVRQDKRSNAPSEATKAHFHRPLDGPAPGILDALTALTTATQPAAPTDRLLVEALLYACLKLLKEPSGHTGGKADRTFQNICLYLQENFQFPLTRDSVADHFRLSPNHVSRLFRSEGLMRFTDYLTWVRLDRAKYLLRNHDSTLGEVAASCGFSDIGYFCRVFKQRTKLTPTAYRLQTHGETQPADDTAR
jgi:AraC-like DNA-binding protein